MPPTSKKSTGHIGFELCVRPSVQNMHGISYEPCMLIYIWIPHGKIADTHFFFFLVRVISISEVMSLWKKSEWNLMHVISCEPCMLGFWNFIYYKDSSWNNSWSIFFFFFLSELSPFLELCPFEKIRMKSCQQDISKRIWAGLKLGQLIRDDELITWLNFKKKITLFFRSYGPLKIWAF